MSIFLMVSFAKSENYQVNNSTLSADVRTANMQLPTTIMMIQI